MDHALEDQAEDISRTYLALLDGMYVGYITVAMDAIPLARGERPRKEMKYSRFPALKLYQLAVDETREGQGIGKQLVALAAMMAIRLRKDVGCRYLTLDAAEPWLVDWYARQDFTINETDQAQREKKAKDAGRSVSDLATSMRLDLHYALVDLQDHFPRDFPRGE